MRLARHADTPSRRSPDTCSPEPGDKSPGYCHLSLRGPSDIVYSCFDGFYGISIYNSDAAKAE